jgi:hypothetical protein
MHASGRQELVIEHPDPAMTHVGDAARPPDRRAAALPGPARPPRSDPRVRHVQVTRTTGRAAGALVDHPHGQVLAVPVPNRWVEEEAPPPARTSTRTGSLPVLRRPREDLRRASAS